MNKSIVIPLAALMVILPLQAPAEDGPNGDAGRTETSDESRFDPAGRLISFFRDHLSAVDGDRCPSEPNCSTYSVQAFRKHGFIMGWIMTVDRLIHEGKGETKVSPTVLSNGKWKIYDPVENNDFWWHQNKKTEKQETESLIVDGPTGP